MKINKIFKRFVSGLITASMLISMAAFPVLAEDKAAVFAVTFDEGGDSYELKGGELVDGRNGKALSLSGTGQYAQIAGAGDALKAISGDFSISVWCKPDTLSTWARVFDAGTGENVNTFLSVQGGGNKPRFAIKNGTEFSFDSDTALTTDEWHNLTVTRKDGVCTFYIDGFAETTSESITYNYSELDKFTNCYLGKSQYPDPYFDGLIDDFKIYDYALNETAVQTIAAEAYEAKRKKDLLENNCYIFETHFYDNASGEEILATNEEAYITDKSTENGASFKVNGTTDFTGMTAYVAQYTAEKKLSAVTLKAVNNAEMNIPYTKKDNTSDVKIFVWRNMTPVADGNPSVKITVNAKNYTTKNGTAVIGAYVGGSSTPADTKSIDLASMAEDNVTLSVVPNGQTVTVKAVTPKSNATETNDIAMLYRGLKSPVAAPVDSSTTTFGAHDPSIVKFDGDDTYYVYSSHHLIFTSKDLVNWTKYDFTSTHRTTTGELNDKGELAYPNAKLISPKTYDFIYSQYKDKYGNPVKPNGTYWAPDVIYKKGDNHPYWAYISISCGLGGRNSAITLMKSDSPLFWADENADIIDAGVVYATQENDAWVTNAIDANIYTDTDGKQYFVWGSFWGGIQAVELNADGTVKGVDYSNNGANILNSCKNVKTTVFSQKGGVAGPEGAWMIDHGDYRYMFTSYGWLGSNYNTRVARSPLSKSFGTDTSTQLVDANGVKVGNEYSAGSTSNITGYKMIGSYRLGDGSMTAVEDSYNNWYYPRSADGAHIYYGPGHNSAIVTENGESFYVSHTRKDNVEGAAYLQARKMLFTADGWPVVSPVTYAGEVEQVLPKSMIVGTYDLASVGQTKFAGTDTSINNNWKDHSGNRNYDLPVLSSKVTLNEDGTMADGLGTWEFDNDHTVTLKFTKNGNTSKDEFYKSGDVMTMYALFGYDKDERESVIALTGTDQKHITQFAKKSLKNIFKTSPDTVPEPDPVTITKSAGGNPELGFDDNGNILYAGDPAATVIDTDNDGEGDTVYLIAGHDTSTNEGYNMPNWVLYTSTDMTNWDYKGIVLDESTITWTNDKNSAWASQMTPYTNKTTGITKYYLYYCAETKHDTYNGKSIGVAVADKPEGPYVDIGKPLVLGSFTEPSTSNFNDIDPTVLIDTDENDVEHRYLAWGNGKYYICELNEDMTSIKDLDGDGQIVMHKDVLEREIKSLPNGNWFTEAPWLYKRNGKYYMFYAQNWREEMAYAMCDTPMGRYDFKQILMPPTATSNTNHPSVIDFKDKTYFIYHNGSLPHGSGFRRSVCIQELEFDDNGYVKPLTETSIGLTGTANVIKTKNGKYVGHSDFRNSSLDGAYPISVPVTVSETENAYATAWEILPGKADKDNVNYVSIQSVDKPGLYISSTGSGVTLTQDVDNSETTAKQMTFKTVKALNGDANAVSFVSVSNPGQYLTIVGSSLAVSYGTDADGASFTIANTTAAPNPVIGVAEPETFDADITENFNSRSTGTLISLQATDTPAYTAINGLTLYIGMRSSGANGAQNFSIAAGGKSGNALKLNAGAYQSASRGPRLQINRPAIPNGHVVTASISVKGGTADSILNYNDSTANDSNLKKIDGISTEWKTLTMSIKNENEKYTRTLKLGDTVIFEDNYHFFPVFWGTTANNSGQSILFDDLSIVTTTLSGEKPAV